MIEVGAVERAEPEFEENIIYTGHGLDPRRAVLRLRKVDGRALLTYKERLPSSSEIKYQTEDETTVGDAGALVSILEALGYHPVLVYEKRRRTWKLPGAEVVLDELPFGLFAEIEGDETSIMEAERRLKLHDAEAEHATYPELTERYGTKTNSVIEARFEKK